MYRWGLFYVLRSEQYKLLIMSVIKFCMSKEGGKNTHSLKETFCAAYSMFSL